MMQKVISILFIFFVLIGTGHTAKSQSIELLAGNTFNGAANGTILGGAVMGLTNNSDFAPLRIGVGLGTLYGIGVGIYDLTNTKGSQMIVTGIFNDGNNSSIIVLLDTFYGAAAGSIIASSVMLIANEPIVKGLQYGASAGAIAGFGFGIIDSFVISDRIIPGAAASTTSASGLIAMNFNNRSSIGFLSPDVITTLQFNNTDLEAKINPAINLINLKISL